MSDQLIQEEIQISKYCSIKFSKHEYFCSNKIKYINQWQQQLLSNFSNKRNMLIIFGKNVFADKAGLSAIFLSYRFSFEGSFNIFTLIHLYFKLEKVKFSAKAKTINDSQNQKKNSVIFGTKPQHQKKKEDQIFN